METTMHTVTFSFRPDLPAEEIRTVGTTTVQSLRKKGLPFTEYYTTGGHDNNCWCQMFTEFARAIIWK